MSLVFRKVVRIQYCIRNGILDFQRILENMDEFTAIEFGIGDIVRSGLVKSYLISKMSLGL